MEKCSLFLQSKIMKHNNSDPTVGHRESNVNNNPGGATTPWQSSPLSSAINHLVNDTSSAHVFIAGVGHFSIVNVKQGRVLELSSADLTKAARAINIQVCNVIHPAPSCAVDISCCPTLPRAVLLSICRPSLAPTPPPNPAPS